MARGSTSRVGVYVDGTYLSTNGGHGMRYDVLREFATRDDARLSRMNVYVSLDSERAADDPGYRRGQDSFCASLRDFGYKVIQKPLRFAGRPGSVLHMAVDALVQGDVLDRVLLVTGNGDFDHVIRALQHKGCRVEVVAFDNAAPELREEADTYLSGFLLPNLLPIPDQTEREKWGTVGSVVRGVCYTHSGKGYGFLRYIRRIGPGLWITDSRRSDSPYETVFFHDSQLPRDVSYTQLPSRELIFEFELAESDKFDGDVQAVNLELVTGPESVSQDLSYERQPA